MTNLNHTVVYRGGFTSSYWNLETRKCYISVDTINQHLSVNFDISSKGGGVTQIRLDIGQKDFIKMFQSITEEMPETINIFSELLSRSSENLKRHSLAKYEMDSLSIRLKAYYNTIMEELNLPARWSIMRFQKSGNIKVCFKKNGNDNVFILINPNISEISNGRVMFGHNAPLDDKQFTKEAELVSNKVSHYVKKIEKAMIARDLSDKL